MVVAEVTAMATVAMVDRAEVVVDTVVTAEAQQLAKAMMAVTLELEKPALVAVAVRVLLVQMGIRHPPRNRIGIMVAVVVMGRTIPLLVDT